MNRFTSPFAAAITSLVAGVYIAASSNAQSTLSDEVYCQSLVKAFESGREQQGDAMVDFNVGGAIARCRAGDSGPTISLLEQRLRATKIPVPLRIDSESMARAAGSAHDD